MKTFIYNTLALLLICFTSSCHNHDDHHGHDHSHHVHDENCGHDHGPVTSGALFQLQPNSEFENILMEELNTDSLSTSYVIWVKNNVRKHMHAVHTETVYILDGKAEVVVNGDTSIIQGGDFMVFPPKTPHEVTKVISKKPLKVLSIQSPQFFGKDRVFLD